MTPEQIDAAVVDGRIMRGQEDRKIRRARLLLWLPVVIALVYFIGGLLLRW